MVCATQGCGLPKLMVTSHLREAFERAQVWIRKCRKGPALGLRWFCLVCSTCEICFQFKSVSGQKINLPIHPPMLYLMSIYHDSSMYPYSCLSILLSTYGSIYSIELSIDLSVHLPTSHLYFCLSFYQYAYLIHRSIYRLNLSTSLSIPLPI